MSAPTLMGDESRASMRANVSPRVLPFKSRTGLSAFQRLGLRWGCKADTAKDRIYGERGVYQMVADANEAFLQDGLPERVAFLMAPVDASLLTEVPNLTEAIYRHNRADAVEDCAQAEFIGNAGDTELDEWIRKLAQEAYAIDALKAALVKERELRKAGK